MVGAAALVVLGLAGWARRPRARLAAIGVAAAAVAMLGGPAAWAASVLDIAYAGSSFDASAGPVGTAAAGSPARFALAMPGSLRVGVLGGAGAGQPGGAAVGGGLLATATTALSSAEQRIYDYASAHRRGASYLMAVRSWSAASPYILATGQEVLPLGGFSGTVPEPTLARVQQLVRGGQLRFFLLDAGAGRGPGAGGGAGEQRKIASWVESSCGKVPARDYGGGSAASGVGASAAAGGGGGGGSATLYECGEGG